ncbi:unnamed protein product [Effrenium voratum]|uniref:Uncharacterized protein n=1 Tax=Effrenium voratum TaxID=2562239 RepID=A0AA36MRV2_9DINO|nr:unnamed protein product [Effrenium voratum]
MHRSRQASHLGWGAKRRAVAPLLALTLWAVFLHGTGEAQREAPSLSSRAFVPGMRTPRLSKFPRHAHKEKPLSFEELPQDAAHESNGLNSWNATRMVLSTSLVALLLSVGTAMYFQTSSPQLSSEQVTYAAWYSRVADRVRALVAEKPVAGIASIAKRIRNMSSLLDVTQEDVYTEFWESLQSDVLIFRAYLPLLDYFMASTYPHPTPQQESVLSALQFELSRFRQALSDFDACVRNKNIRGTEKAFAELSVAYDRYLKGAALYEGYDPMTSTEILYKDITDAQLVYTPSAVQKPAVRDEVLVIRGPDKGKIGRVIWLYDQLTATVKLEPNPLLGGSEIKGFREVKSFPQSWIALTRTNEQNRVLDLVMAALATFFTCCVTYPLETIKARVQAAQPLLDEQQSLGGLYNGLVVTLIREIPAKSLYISGFNSITRFFCLLPFIDANNADLKLLVMIPAGALAYFPGTFLRAPFELLSRQMQTGMFDSEEAAVTQLLSNDERLQQSLFKSWALVLLRGLPFGALQYSLYDFLHEHLEVVQYGIPLSLQPVIWGALSGAMTGLLTNPPDLVLSVLLTQEEAKRSDEDEDVFEAFARTSGSILEAQGVAGFFQGASARAVQIGMESCVFFTILEGLKDGAKLILDF